MPATATARAATSGSKHWHPAGLGSGSGPTAQKNQAHAVNALELVTSLSLIKSNNVVVEGALLRSSPEARDWNGAAILDVDTPSDFTMIAQADFSLNYMLGICLSNADLEQPSLFKTNGYYIFAGKGELHGQDGTAGKKNEHLPNMPCRRIRLRFEAEPRPMLYGSANDGPMKALSFDRPLPMGEWRPCVLFYSGGSAVSLSIKPGKPGAIINPSLTEKMWDDAHRAYADAEVWAEGRTFQVHRNVLSAASPRFRQLFDECEREGRPARVEFHDASSYAVESLLKYIYTKDGPERDAVSVLPLAFRFGLEGLLQICGRNMIASLTVENAASAVAALRAVKDVGPMQTIWSDVQRKVKNDPPLLNSIMNKVSIQ